MSIKNIVTSQYRDTVNLTAKQLTRVSIPSEGWICTVRKALNMSGAQLARLMGVTRARISKSEQSEINGAVTLKTMQKTAEAMGCRFVYAIVPEQNIENIIKAQAKKKAFNVVQKANNHMALEAQALSDDKIKFEIKRLTQEMLNNMPRDFWDNNSNRISK